ncbi:uncharacterized protein ACN63O_007303 [Diretmus argenteus]
MHEHGHISYKYFRRRIVQRRGCGGPFASTPSTPRPLATGRQHLSSFEFDSVCQRLVLDSPTRESADPNSAQDVTEGSHQGSDNEISSDLQPFAILNNASMSPQSKAVMKLAAPSLLNDYYTNLLDCSCNGMVALALGSSVYLWNSETLSLEGHLHPSPPPPTPQPGRPCHQRHAVSSLSWSPDGRALAIGTRRGEVQLWDVEQKCKVSCLQSHLSVVGGLSWKQHLLSSGSVLGRIHHHDPRAPAPLVGAAVQQGGVCSLEWSPGEDWLASGSTDGLLSIWGSDITGFTRSRQPVITMKQPSAVKAMGWCPWQRQLIATGGGWKDGELRMWDTQSGSCISSAHTNSQICSLRWDEKKRALVTGHGVPHHQVTCWTWESSSLRPSYQLAVVCHGLTVSQIVSRYSRVQRALSWYKAREFCQRHYVDLAVLSTEEQYFNLLNTTAADKFSSWIGLQRQSIYGGWKWVDGEELNYQHWYRENYMGRCASLEATLEKDNKLLGRFCQEPHRFVCQGPVSPQEVKVDFIEADHVILTWNVSAFMQRIPHSYSVTTCTTTCHTFLYPYTDGSTSCTINISNLTSGTEYFIDIAAVVVRPDNVTGENVTLQSTRTALQVKRDATKVSGPEQSSVELSSEETIDDLILDKTQEIC